MPLNYWAELDKIKIRLTFINLSWENSSITAAYEKG